MLGNFKGANTALAKQMAKQISKSDFLAQLKTAWYPLIKINTDLEVEVTNALKRIKKSGFQDVFKIVKVTDEDIRQVLKEIKEEKASIALKNVKENNENK